MEDGLGWLSLLWPTASRKCCGGANPRILELAVPSLGEPLLRCFDMDDNIEMLVTASNGPCTPDEEFTATIPALEKRRSEHLHSQTKTFEVRITAIQRHGLDQLHHWNI